MAAAVIKEDVRKICEYYKEVKEQTNAAMSDADRYVIATLAAQFSQAEDIDLHIMSLRNWMKNISMQLSCLNATLILAHNTDTTQIKAADVCAVANELTNTIQAKHTDK